MDGAPRPTASGPDASRVENIGHSLEGGGVDRSRRWGLGIEPEYADAMIAAERTDMVIGEFEREYRQKKADERMVEAVPVAVHGGDRRSTAQKAVKAIKPPDQADDVSSKKSFGNNADYLAARIKRDRPDITQARHLSCCLEGSGAHVEEGQRELMPRRSRARPGLVLAR